MYYGRMAAWRFLVKGSAELSRGKVELWGRCWLLQRAMMNGVLVGFFHPSFCSRAHRLLSFEAALSLTRRIG